MRRRTLVLTAAAATFAGLVFLASLAVYVATSTTWGLEYVRGFALAQAKGAVKGSLYVGRLSGSLLGDLRIDSLEIRDPHDSLFIASGPIALTYDVRDLVDRRIEIRRLETDRLHLRVHEYPDGGWNWKEVFPPARGRAPVSPTRGFGDFVVVDTLVVRDAALTFIQPWRLPDTLTARARDSIVREARRFHDIRDRPGGGWEKTYRWTGGWATSTYARIAHPDTAGQLVVVQSARMEESDPPLSFRDARGTVRKHGDTVWLDLEHLALANSTGTGRGVIAWGGGIPMRWDVRIESDSACLSDYTWVYETLPRTGCGRLDLWIHNKPQDLEVMLYELTNLDVTSTKSRLAGRMTFGVGRPELEVTDVDLELAPADMDLLRTFKGGPFPYDFQGALWGRVRAPGGPVSRFVVREADLTYRDRHVRGAIIAGRGEGMLDITQPAEARFRDFALDARTVDLRTIRFLNPEFPELNGIVRGRARLDSLWYDVRFRDAAFEHVDGEGPTTVLRGAGRMTLEDSATRFDVALVADPLSFPMIRRSYPRIPIEVPMRGPLRLVGTADSLAVSARFEAPAGALAFDGIARLLPPLRGFDGTWTFDSLDARRLFAADALPVTSLAGRVSGRLAADTLLATMQGAVDVELGRSLVDSMRIFGAFARLRAGDSLLVVDTLRLESAAAVVTARGGIGLAPSRRDSLQAAVTVDSLGGLRRWLASAPGSLEDTLAGTLQADVRVAGHVDSLDVAMRLAGAGLVRNGLRAQRVEGALTVADALATRRLRLDLLLDTLRAGGLPFTSARVEARPATDGVTAVTIEANARTGPALAAQATVRPGEDSTVTVLERGTLAVGGETWTLGGPSRLVLQGGDLAVDSLVLAGPAAARVRIAGRLPERTPMDLGVRASQVPLATLARLAGSDLGVRGLLDLDVRATGTRAAPLLASTLRLADVAATGARGYRLEGTADYADRRATLDVRMLGAGGPIGTVQLGLPLDLAFEPRAARRPGDGVLSGRFEAQGTPLAVLEAFTTAVTDAQGTIDATVDLSGTWDAPRLRGALVATASRVGVPALGRITLQDVEAAVRFLGDTIQLQRLEMTSRSGGRLARASRAGRLRGDGTVTFTDIADPRFDLSLSTDNFNAVARPGLADLDLSGALRLTGPASRAELAGALTVNRGTLTIPDLTNKDVIDVADPDFVRVVDTALFSRARLLPSRPSRLVSNLAVNDVRIAMGGDVWLRSAEANINLGGDVRVGRRRVVAGADTARAILSLDGTLLVNRGTYRLNIADVVQRTFDVEQGRIVFSPNDPSFNPGLDIAAVHTVRNFNSTLVQQDRRIRVRIGGTLQQPSLRFESADNTQLSQSDLISYLITGAPAFGVGDPTETAGAASTAANVLLASLSSVLADRIAALGYLDYVQIQTAGLDRGLQAAGAAPVDPAQQILSLTRIGGGVQLSDRLFLSGDAGLCPFVQPSANASVWNQLGIRLEYRLSSSFTASAGVEPPTQSLLCGAANVRGFVLTPQQIGLDLTSAWRF